MGISLTSFKSKTELGFVRSDFQYLESMLTILQLFLYKFAV